MYTSSNLTMKAILLLLSFLAHHGYAWSWMLPNEDTTLKNVQNGANKFSLELFKATLKSKPDRNLISSPFSAYMVLAMASYGADGATKEAFEKVLHLPKLRGAYSKDIDNSFRAITQKLLFLKPVSLKVCNKVYASSKLGPVKSQYGNILRDSFQSPPDNVNFRNPKKTAQIINSWGSKCTNNTINNIISADKLNGDMALMLLNAVYFYGQWKVPFDPQSTILRPFHVNEKLTKKVPMMLHVGEFQYGKLPQMDATFVVLPYGIYQDGGRQEDATYMYIIRPNEKYGLSQIEKNIDSLTLKDLHNTEENELELHVPKFKLESTIKLNSYLSQMGLQSAFSDGANFHEMFRNSQNLKINRVVQKSFIFINEKGTEAAAITDAELTFKMGPTEYKINRPFLILLATKEIILFAGRVMDPSA